MTNEVTLAFADSAFSIETMAAFKKSVLAALKVDHIHALETDEDWQDLLCETRVAMTTHNGVALHAFRYADLNNSAQFHNIDVIRGKKKLTPCISMTPEEIEAFQAEMKIESSRIDAKHSGLNLSAPR